MSSGQTWPSRASASENSNYNQATCQPSACDFASHHAVSSASGIATPGIFLSTTGLRAPENLEPAYATPLAADQPAAIASAPYIIPMVRRLLAEAQAMFPEPGQLDRSTTVMDMILDHRLLIRAAILPANGHYCLAAPRNCALRCRADLDAYWAQQGEEKKFVSTTARNVEAPVSVERSTMTWPPDLDGDLWDCAS